MLYTQHTQYYIISRIQCVRMSALVVCDIILIDRLRALRLYCTYNTIYIRALHKRMATKYFNMYHAFTLVLIPARFQISHFIKWYAYL